MATDTVETTWQGTFEAELPDGTILTPGETKVKVSAGEARESENWSAKPTKKQQAEQAETETAADEGATSGEGKS